MAKRDLTAAECQVLEGLVDAANLEAVLQALSAICGEKAEHIQASYDDPHLAKAWRQAEGVIGVCSTDAYIARVSR